MAKLLIQTFFMLGTYASLLSIILVSKPPGEGLSCSQLVLSGTATILLLAAVGVEFTSYIRGRPTLFQQEDHAKINNFMHRWISGGGRAAIFSHDLTWVDERITALLRTKAERNELEIFVPRRAGRVAVLLDDLEERGAKVLSYPELGYVPKSRFTIVNRGRMGPRVAVGRGVGDKWRIDVFSEGEDPVFAVANDLLEIVVNLAKMRQAHAPGA